MSTQVPQEYTGSLLVPEGARFALVASRFNGFIVERLIEGARDALLRHGARPENLLLARVPGSWELPLVCTRLARTQKFQAVIALGCVIRGATPHFEHVAMEALKGVAQAASSTGVPVTLGVLTTDSVEQAIERAGCKAGNKGFDAALSAIEMVNLNTALSQAGY